MAALVAAAHSAVKEHHNLLSSVLWKTASHTRARASVSAKPCHAMLIKVTRRRRRRQQLSFLDLIVHAAFTIIVFTYYCHGLCKFTIDYSVVPVVAVMAAVLSISISSDFFPMKWSRMFIGMGKMMVELCSAAMLLSVWR